MKADVGKMEITGPSWDATASASAYSFKNTPLWPGTHTKRPRCKCLGTREQSACNEFDKLDVVTEQQTDRQSVKITTDDRGDGNLRKAKTIANNSA